ncbi:MAG: PepSY domain-containing protein [Gammaproteobacteria bacterium]|nr:PepSY domain-containing protein [Gammaproteobacteria bacterium]
MHRRIIAFFLMLALSVASVNALAKGGEGGAGNGGAGNGGAGNGGEGSGNAGNGGAGSGQGPGQGQNGGVGNGAGGAQSGAMEAAKPAAHGSGAKVDISRIEPLQTVLQRVQQDYEGKVLAVALETGEEESEARPVYRVKLLTSTGSVLKLWYDAIDMRLLDIKGQQGRH